MRISELVARSGVPIATVKYYLREGILTPGARINARDAVYTESHLARLRLVRGLVHVLGASVSQVKQVLEIIDAPGQPPIEAMGRATSVLPAAMASDSEPDSSVPHQALQTLTRLGYRIDPDSAVVRQLDSALSLAESVGIPIDTAQILAYGNAARETARADFTRIPWDDPDAATTFAVLGTVLYEPILLALRRLAHYELGIEHQAANPVGAEVDTTKETS